MKRIDQIQPKSREEVWVFTCLWNQVYAVKTLKCITSSEQEGDSESAGGFRSGTATRSDVIQTRPKGLTALNRLP